MRMNLRIICGTATGSNASWFRFSRRAVSLEKTNFTSNKARLEFEKNGSTKCNFKMFTQNDSMLYFTFLRNKDMKYMTSLKPRFSLIKTFTFRICVIWCYTNNNQVSFALNFTFIQFQLRNRQSDAISGHISRRWFHGGNGLLLIRSQAITPPDVDLL